jgi:hypothetical protein
MCHYCIFPNYFKFTTSSCLTIRLYITQLTRLKRRHQINLTVYCGEISNLTECWSRRRAHPGEVGHLHSQHAAGWVASLGCASSGSRLAVHWGSEGSIPDPLHALHLPTECLSPEKNILLAVYYQLVFVIQHHTIQ